MIGGSRVRLTVMAVVALLLTVGTLAARARPLSNIVELLVAVGSPFVPLLALAGLFLAILCRRLLLTLVALVVLAATVAVQMSWYYVARPNEVGEHAELRVLSSNLRKGQAEDSAFVDLARGADVVAVSELTPEAMNALIRQGVGSYFKYSILFPSPGAGGIGLWSRFPLTTVESARRLTSVAAKLHIPGVRIDPVIASVHVTSPLAYDVNSVSNWQAGIAVMKEELGSFADAAGPGAVIVAGDFNSTPDMRQFRDLLTNGYRDAVQQTGSGFAPTFPSNKPFPPLITIDHVLTRNAVASSIETVELPGSDHRSLLATIKVPIDPTAS